MAQDQRAPGADVVDVFVAIDVENVTAPAVADERRYPADRTESARRTVDTAGNNQLRRRKGGGGLVAH